MNINTILFILNIFIILVISLFNFESIKDLKLYRYDNFIHFIIYFFLALVITYNIKANNIVQLLPRIVFVLILPITTEYLQFYRPNRAADIYDLYYDYIGLTAGLIVIVIYKYVKRD